MWGNIHSLWFITGGVNVISDAAAPLNSGSGARNSGIPALRHKSCLHTFISPLFRSLIFNSKPLRHHRLPSCCRHGNVNLISPPIRSELFLERLKSPTTQKKPFSLSLPVCLHQHQPYVLSVVQIFAPELNVLAKSHTLHRTHTSFINTEPQGHREQFNQLKPGGGEKQTVLTFTFTQRWFWLSHLQRRSLS